MTPQLTLTGAGPSAAALSYIDKVVGLCGANLIAYWPLSEASGTVADNYEGTAARDGAYTGVTLGQTGIGDGLTCPRFDGAVGDRVNVYSNSLNTAFDGAEGTIAFWIKMYNASVWTDGVLRKAYYIRADSNNYISWDKQGIGSVWVVRKGGGTSEIFYLGAQSDTGWVHWAMSWSEAADEVKLYKNGVGTGGTLTSLGAWAGSLASVYCNIGAQDSNNQITNGWIAHVAICNAALPPATILQIATV